jgi:hypothetical protein
VCEGGWVGMECPQQKALLTRPSQDHRPTPESPGYRLLVLQRLCCPPKEP